VKLLPTGPAEALNLRVALERLATVQARHPTNSLGPGIAGAAAVPTCAVRRVLNARQAFVPRTIRRDYMGDIGLGAASNRLSSAGTFLRVVDHGWPAIGGFGTLAALTRRSGEPAGRPSVASVELRPACAYASPRASRRRCGVSSP